MDYPEIYAVDFDKTLNLADTYPELGEPNMELIEFLKGRRAAGDKIILWTCREGELLKEAVKYCNDCGLFFHAVNDNLPENIAYYGNNCRKVWAHHYIDDRNMTLITATDHASGSDMTVTVIAEVKKTTRIPVSFGQGIAPYCPRCGSGEYLHNEDGNENNFCGQCGAPLDWSQMHNEDTGRIEEKLKCGDCVEYLRSKYKYTTGLCKAKGVYVSQSKPACKRRFKKAMHVWGGKKGEDGKIN